MIQSSATQQAAVRKSPALADAPLCVHLGLPKTATTMLQEYLFAKHSQLNYLGKHSPPAKHYIPDKSMNSLVTSVINPNRTYPPSAVNDLRQTIKSAVISGKTSIFSKEGWCGLSEEKRARFAVQLKKTVGNCRVLLTIREPLSFVESLYFQKLQGFHNGKYPNLKEHFGQPPKYFDVNTWLQTLLESSKINRTLFNKLRYADTAEYYASVFGKDRVKVLAFEQLKSSPEQFIGKLSSFLEIEPDEALLLSQNKRANDRWTEESIKQLTKLQKSWIKRWIFRSRDLERRRQMLGVDKNSQATSSTKAKAEINDEFREMILDITREQSRRIEKDWGLPLSQYGYDC